MSAVPHGRRRGILVRPLLPFGPEAATAALADWLFWDQGIGLSFAVFCATLVGAAHLMRPFRLHRRSATAVVLLIIGLAPAIENLAPLSVAFALLATAAAAGLALPVSPPIPQAAIEAIVRWIAGPRRVCQDLREYTIWRRRHRSVQAQRWTDHLVWVLSLTAGSVFLALFADANPVIADLLSDIPRPTFSLPTLVPRAAFWIGVAVVVWPVVRPRRDSHRRSRAAAVATPTAFDAIPPALRDLLFGEAAIMRALLLCNGLFALQLALDGAYLWAGAALPRGMTYAQYAHRGAYPLVLTALIAGGFVLLLRRQGAGVQNRPVPTGLLLLFTGQNVFLVGSAARRLGLYVGAYELTEWRVAAFCWMGVVACGLVLIGAQVTGNRSNVWLASRAALVAVAVLYGWGLIDVPGMVARYDVAHCAEMTGVGPALDLDMLLDLGPSALPAIAAVQERLQLRVVDQARDNWARTVRRDADDWRRWSFRAWRLNRWLDSVGAASPTNGRDERQAR